VNRVTLQLPEELWAYLEEQIASGAGENPAEYVRELLRQDMERRRLALVRDLREGLAGPMRVISEADIRERGLVSVLRQPGPQP